MIRRFSKILGLLALTQLTAVAGEIRYHVVRCGHLPGGHGTGAYSISDRGAITGWGIGHQGMAAIYWSTETGMIEIGDLPGGLFSAEGLAINYLGAVAGFGHSSREGGCAEALMWSVDTGVVGLGDRPGGACSSIAYAINDQLEIVGSASGENDHTGFYWNATEGMISIGDLPGGPLVSDARGINNQGQAVGASGDAQGIRAFIWDRENGMSAMPTAPGIYPQDGRDINNLGQVCGTAYTPRGIEGYLWDPEAGYTIIRLLPGMRYLWAENLNDRGEVLVTYDLGTYSRNGVWDARRGLHRVESVNLDPCAGPVQYVRAHDINAGGWLAAQVEQEAAIPIPYIPGDLNEDSTVDLADLCALLRRFGASGGASYPDVDLDCDADVDLQDLATLLSNFGETYP